MSSRRGLPWSPEELNDVLDLVTQNKTHQEIADAKERTLNSIRFKLLSYACNEHLKNGKSLWDVQTLTGLSADDINAELQKRATPKPVAPKEKKAVVVLTSSEELKAILNDLNKLQGRLARYVSQQQAPAQ